MLVTPVQDDQTAVLGLGLLRRAVDPTREVTTAARLIDNAQVADRVRRDLHLPDSSQAVLRRITVDPVAITAATESPRKSQQLANAFATAAVQERTDQLHRELDPLIRNMRRQIRGITGDGTAAAASSATQPLFQQLGAMEALRSGPDPTLRFETPAALPTTRASPRVKLDVAAG